jgi:CubicO group peptidase (beta-lactamase class C family)
LDNTGRTPFTAGERFAILGEMIDPRCLRCLPAIGLLATFVSTTPAFAAPDFAKLESTIHSEMERADVPGCAVAIVLDDQVIFAKGFGVSSVDTGGEITPDTLFRLGSTTKMFTAAALVSLVEEGKVKLDRPIGDYVKGLHPKLARLTAHQLLTHTAGLADETRMDGLHDDSALGEATRALKDELCFTEPDRIWSYSNPGYWLAGLVTEEVSGKSYADAVRERVLAPLGMKRSAFRPTEAMTWPLAIGHGPGGPGKARVIRPLADNAGGRPAGQLFTSANEYARFCTAFMNGGRLEGKQALSPFVIDKLSGPHVPVPGTARHYGYGLTVEDQDGLRWLSHTGNRTGYGSQVKMCPAKKFAVIILCNKSGENLPRVANQAVRAVLGISPPMPSRELKIEPIAEAHLQRYAGVYSNGRSVIRLSVKDGKLHAPIGDIEWVGENRFRRSGAAGAAAEPELVFVPDEKGKIEYLMRAGRALKKTQ